MGDRSSYEQGTPNWADLSTSDAAGAKAFYGELLGWEYRDEPVPGGTTYTQARADGKVVAGIYQGDGSRPTVWNNYIAVDSADETAARAAELGATVAMGPFDVMEIGRMAFIQDPQGAFIAFWESRGHFGAEYVNGPGAMCWNELATSDVEGAKRFYGELFGYGWDSMDMGEQGTYWIPKVGDRGVGGLMQMPPGGPPMPMWLAYFGSADADATAARARELGGQVLREPSGVGDGMGRLAILRDPQGGVFGIWAGRFTD
jgi:predicted enzyme related to lactoylglutathione lyase